MNSHMLGRWELLPRYAFQSRVLKPICLASSALRGSRQYVLDQVDMELSKGEERAALFLVKSLQGQPNGLRCFGAARQVPKKLYNLEDLKLNGIYASSLLSPVDTSLSAIERNIQIVAAITFLSTGTILGFNLPQNLLLLLGFFTIFGVDLVLFDGGVKSLILDSIGHALSPRYHHRVIQHEAGHFLVAYLLGILPRGYTLSGLEALQREGSLNVQAGTAFVDFEFVEEVNAGKVSAQTLDKFSCVALAGVATEYLLFGLAEGGLADIVKLDRLFKGLGFTQKKADYQVRWAVLNTVTVLRRHEEALSKVAEAMSKGKTVGSCIDIIERSVNIADI